MTTPQLPPRDIVRAYLTSNFRIVTWPHIGDSKGPKDKGWPDKLYTLEDYQDGHRVGLFTGTEMAPGKWVHDVDIDWSPGSLIAQALLPPTAFVFGRLGKKVSHCFYTTSEPLPTYRYEDIDKTCLIELRGTKSDGHVGFQTMVPPSIWTKDGAREPLTFLHFGAPAHLDTPSHLKQRVCLSAIGMILAKHFGPNGFGHEARLVWAGYLLRLGLSVEELVPMGEALSVICKNVEVHDVRRAVESTAARLHSETKHKIKGGPSLARLLGEHGKAVVARIAEWLGRDSDFVRNKNGVIIPKSPENIKRAFEILGHELSYNEFADKLLIDNKPLEDRELTACWMAIDAECHFQPPETFFERVVKHLAWSNSFHPVKDYLNSLTWDGETRLETWLVTSASAEDTPYVRAISSIMLIAAVRRIYHPGAKYDEMVVWEGHQGSGKSSAAQALCPNSAWFSDDLPLNVDSKQVIEKTLGKWIIEASDLAGKRKAEIEQLKAMMSRGVDGPARLAYAHFPVERPRHFIMVGTTNSNAYLPDPTGARRFWPVVVQPFDLEWIKTHRDQLWAEAGVMEKAGASIRLPEELWPAATEQQEQRREVDPWEGLIRDALTIVDPSSDGKRRVTTSALWQMLMIPPERRDRLGSLRLTEIMTRLGFVRTRVRPQGETVQVGFVQEYDRLHLLESVLRLREPGEDDGF